MKIGNRRDALRSRRPLRAMAGLAALLSAQVLAQTAADPTEDMRELRRRLEAAQAELARLQGSIREQEKRLQEDRTALEAQRRKLLEIEAVLPGAPRSPPGTAMAGSQRGSGSEPSDAPSASALRGPVAAADLARSAGRGEGSISGASASDPGQPAASQAPNPRQPVGQAPERSTSAPPEIAPIFDQPGVLTAKGQFVLEPFFDYAYTSNSRVSVIGFEIFPALLLGVLDISKLNDTVYTTGLTARYGVTNRFELEAKVPYVYRQQTLQARDFLTASFQDSNFNASGSGLGDVELAARYQFNQGGEEKPYYVGTLRLKTRTGTDPFEVARDATLPRGSGRFLTLPTGTGFYALRPELTVIYPSDPVVFFGSVNYLWNLSRTVTNQFGQTLTINPGDGVGFNFGMGLALNERASFSVGYEQTIYGKSKINGITPASELTTQIGTLQLGYSYKLSSKTYLNLALGIGATQDAPNVEIHLRFPTNF